jgi:hypothetical protein
MELLREFLLWIFFGNTIDALLMFSLLDMQAGPMFFFSWQYWGLTLGLRAS